MKNMKEKKSEAAQAAARKTRKAILAGIDTAMSLAFKEMV